MKQAGGLCYKQIIPYYGHMIVTYYGQMAVIRNNCHGQNISIFSVVNIILSYDCVQPYDHYQSFIKLTHVFTGIWPYITAVISFITQAPGINQEVIIHSWEDIFVSNLKTDLGYENIFVATKKYLL